MLSRFPQIFICLLLSGFAAAATPKPAALLPSSLAGWRLTTADFGNDPAKVDAANSALLREYGFKDFENATYERDGRTLKLRAIRFADGTGSFGTFSFYAQPEMQNDQIGDRAATRGDHVLFLRANVVVDALFSQPSSMSAAELRQLAQELPVVRGGAGSQPEMISYLPAQGQVPNSLRYVVGPVGLASVGSTVPAQIVDFSKSAEVAVADYRSRWGTEKLTVISYPTPQIAAQSEKALVSFVAAPNQSVEGTIVIPTSSGGDVAFRRSGPLLIYVSGASSDQEARSLADSVNYAADVTWNERPPVTANSVVKLVVYSIVLSLLLIAIFLVLMIFFGGSYFAIRKFFPNVKLPAQDNELIKLNLRE